MSESPPDRRTAIEFMESQRIIWARDFDAVLVGFVLGSLLGVFCTLAVVLAW